MFSSPPFLIAVFCIFAVLVVRQVVTGKISFKPYPFARRRIIDRREKPGTYAVFLGAEVVVLGAIAVIFVELSRLMAQLGLDL